MGLFFYAQVHSYKVRPQSRENLLTLYGGQFTLPTQLIKPIIRLYSLPTEHHSFFRNLPPLFLLVLGVNRSEYYFHWPSLFSFFFFCLSFQNIFYKTITSNSILYLNFCKNFLLYLNKSRISVFLRFPTKTQINRLVKRYETVRFNWYRQCSIPCYAILENCLKTFQSSCSTAQKVSL